MAKVVAPRVSGLDLGRRHTPVASRREALGRNKRRYGYFKCSSRADRLCDLPHLPAWQVEEAIEWHYRTLEVSDRFVGDLRTMLDEGLADEQRLTNEVHDKLRQQLGKLEARESRLIDLAADGLLPRDKILERSNAIRVERKQIEANLIDTTAQLALGAARLQECLVLLSRPQQTYSQSTDEVRRKLNSTFFERFYLDDAERAFVNHGTLRAPFAEIRTAAQAHAQGNLNAHAGINDNRGRDQLATSPEDRPAVLADTFPVRVSSNGVLVELRGIERRSEPRGGSWHAQVRPERRQYPRL